MIAQEAKWIWINEDPQKNEYAYFADEFEWNGEKAIFSIVAETDYILYINERRISFGQFAGYPTEKYCDEIDISRYCEPGRNQFLATVRYEGVNSATHIDDGAGVIFSLALDEQTVLVSNENTPGGYDNRYLQHTTRKITPQLGLSSGMRSRKQFFPTGCVLVQKTNNIKPRPVKKTMRGRVLEGRRVLTSPAVWDLGYEEAGYVTLHIRAKHPGSLQVSYGEHLVGGCVRQHVGNRDFSLDFDFDEGDHTFEQLFVRVAARYLQVNAPEWVEVLFIGLVPSRYPVSERAHLPLDWPDNRIYDTCVRTLRLCMNMHYEDCPWREQALYVLDSRNQMLSGYYAFGDFRFQRANLVFMSKGLRPDGLLELTYPAVNTPAIPFFSLMYPVAVAEYVKHTRDKTIIAEVMPTMRSIMDTFVSRIRMNGLIGEFEEPFWNFYEWTPRSDGAIRTGWCSLILNCAFVYACKHFQSLCSMVGENFEVDLDRFKRNIEGNFFDEATGNFRLYPVRLSGSSQVGNAMALLIGLGDHRTVKSLIEDKSLIPATLSMLPFVYDALILRYEFHKSYIVEDIREKYGQMLAQGATSFWETLDGESAFGGAGSLCHGWSAIPVYYYHILGLARVAPPRF